MSTSTATTTQIEQSVLLPAEQQIPSAASDAKFQSLARGNRNGTLKLRGIPTFSDPLETRKWMKGHMAAAFRYFGKLGYGEGVSGHISMRGTPVKAPAGCVLYEILTASRPHLEGPLLDESICQALLHHQSFGSCSRGQ